jgi:hypothetical protein
MEQLRSLQILDASEELTHIASPTGSFTWQLRRLEELRIGKCHSLSTLGHMSETFPSLRSLELRGVALELDVAHLVGLVSLSRLEMSPDDADMDGLNSSPGYHSFITQAPQLLDVIGLDELYDYDLQILNLDALSSLTSLQILELVQCNGIINLDFLQGLSELHTLILPFSDKLREIGGLKYCPKLTSLDLGLSPDEFLNSGQICDSLREYCFRREPVPIRNIRLQRIWIDLLILSRRMHSVNNPAPSMVFQGCTISVEPCDADPLTAEAWNAAARSDESRMHQYHVPSEGMWQLVAKYHNAI